MGFCFLNQDITSYLDLPWSSLRKSPDSTIHSKVQLVCYKNNVNDSHAVFDGK